MKKISKKSVKKNAEKIGAITMTTAKKGKFTFNISGIGTFSIDWGDGSEIETHNFSDNAGYFGFECRHKYSETVPRTITIISNNTRMLFCNDNELTSLDLSKCAKLKELWCSDNQLTSLDVSQNTQLKTLHCNDNQLTSTSLNFLFETLRIATKPNNLIFIGNNPGTDDCNRSIAENKRWWVGEFEGDEEEDDDEEFEIYAQRDYSNDCEDEDDNDN